MAIIEFDKQSPVYEVNLKQIEELKQEDEQIEKKINELTAKLIDPDKVKLSLEQFLNLSKNAAVAVKSADAIKKDAICRIIFLNLTVDSENVASYRLKPPFDELLKTRHQSLSRESETSLELLNYITKNIEIVDLFNSEVGSYFKGERYFPAQSYPVML